MSDDPNAAQKGRFPQRFLTLLAELGINRKQFCADHGFTDSRLSRWLIGQGQPRAEDLIVMADAFGVTIDYLVGRTDHRTSLPPSHWVVDEDRVDMVRKRIVPPDGGRYAWPIPDRPRVVTSAQLEDLKAELFGKRRKKPKGAAGDES